MDKLFDVSKTFRPKKGFGKGTKLDTLHRYASNTLRATLTGGDLAKAVALPPGEDVREWLAVNCLEFYNVANLVYGIISEFCSGSSCAVMAAGQKYQYLWMDEESGKLMKLSAPDYITRSMDGIEVMLNDPSIFPVGEGSFPVDFVDKVKMIFKRFYRIYAHIFCAHIKEVIALGMETHVNTALKHLTLFVLEFELIDKKEMAPLRGLLAALLPNHPDIPRKKGAEGLSRDVVMEGRDAIAKTLQSSPMLKVDVKISAPSATPSSEAFTKPLVLAAENGDVDSVRLLLDKGANTESKDSEGNTPLIASATNGRDEVVRILLSSGADKNGVNRYSETALHRAARIGHASCVAILIQAGVNVHLRNSSGQKAVDVAVTTPIRTSLLQAESQATSTRPSLVDVNLHPSSSAQAESTKTPLLAAADIDDDVSRVHKRSHSGTVANKSCCVIL